MTKKTVLAIGLDPVHVDFAAMPGLTPDLVRRFIDAEIERVRAAGFDVVSCLTDLGETAEQTVRAALDDQAFDCVVFGAGMRTPPERLLLFETILNLIHERAPGARIAFNSSPSDTADAVLRWIEP